ncbi:MAG: hypothetical protein P0Y64_00425 [Candidatus Sphingomonas colombiensis]|nr:hypothetical protein [Sphingomonas sp.]WEK43364.1 MAG: hypothetical protein P0Y64_00425 [Sphingomonas sp.]
MVANGVSLIEHEDGLSIDGTGGDPIPGGARVSPRNSITASQ